MWSEEINKTRDNNLYDKVQQEVEPGWRTMGTNQKNRCARGWKPVELVCI